MSISCLVCQEEISNATAVGTEEYCPECAQLFRWFRSYFANVEELDFEWITPETTFLELGVESLDYMSWQMEAEEKLGVSISDKDTERIMTVGAFLRILRAEGAIWPFDHDILFREGGCLRVCAWETVKRGKPYNKSPTTWSGSMSRDAGLYDHEIDG